MSISKKVFGLALGLMIATTISTANAQSNDVKEDALLFKIHDITPVKNDDGEVTACDFNTTFYNRSSYTLRTAEVDLGWKDSTINKVVEDEKKESARNRRGRAISETERTTPIDLNTVLEVNSLRPHKQITINSRINTDRCFLLLEDVDFKIKSCNVEGLQDRRGARRTGGGLASDGCTRLFKFVSAGDPQYYLEFKEITLSEQDAQLAAQKKEQQSEINNMYTKALGELDAAGAIVTNIK